MRDARVWGMGFIAGLLAACSGGGSLPANAVKVTPVAGTESIMQCFAQEAEKLKYRILRIDREGGFMDAERRDPSPDITVPREYAGGDRLVIDRLPKEDGVRPLSITPSTFLMEWLITGANRRQRPTSERAIADAKTLAENCRR